MHDVFRAEIDFKPRKGFWNQWVVLLKEDRDHGDERIVLRNMAGYGGENVGEEIEKYVRHRMVRPYLLPVGQLGVLSATGFDPVRCALLAGSEQTRHVNTTATDIVCWDEILGTPDETWNGCFTISGDAVILKQLKKGRLTTFSYAEAAQIAISVAPGIKAEDWYHYATEKAYAAYCDKESGRAKKKHKRKR